jgi:flagellar basal-body rod protein FlgB
MEPVNLFNLAAQQSRWLAVRQSAVAGNVANANTPGYGTVDVEPFEKVLDKTSVTLATTQAGHLGGRTTESGFSIRQEDDSASMLPSKNSVVLENEMLKAGEIRRQFELNTAIVKAFHRMIMLSSKS